MGFDKPSFHEHWCQHRGLRLWDQARAAGVQQETARPGSRDGCDVAARRRWQLRCSEPKTEGSVREKSEFGERKVKSERKRKKQTPRRRESTLAWKKKTPRRRESILVWELMKIHVAPSIFSKEQDQSTPEPLVPGLCCVEADAPPRVRCCSATGGKG